jgi:protein TonB
MASVVMEESSQPALKPALLPPQPKALPKMRQESKPQAAPPVSSQMQPPVQNQTAPSELAPVVPITSPVSATAPIAAASATLASAVHSGNLTNHLKSSATGLVVPPSTNADYPNNAPPSYPRVSKRLGEQGTVLIHVLISTEGRAEKAEILTSSGHARLDETALTTVKTWRFVPGTRNGVPEAMWFNVPVRFVLD